MLFEAAFEGISESRERAEKEQSKSRVRAEYNISGHDEIGRHAGFRFLCRKACGFKSH